MKISILKLVMILLFVAINSVKAEDFSVSVPDTLIPAGKTYLIPVSGKINASAHGTIELFFNFNGLVLDVKPPQGGQSLGFIDVDIHFETPQNWNSVDFKITTAHYNTDYEGILFYLEIEGLIGPDTITTLQPTKYMLNNVEIQAELDGGIIRTTPPIIIQKNIEGIGRCYPNPLKESFPAIGSVNVIIEKASTVKFKVFSPLGRLIQIIPDNDNYIDFDIFNNLNQLVENTEGKIFEPGSYLLKFRPVNFEMATGLYYIVMETKNGVYNTNFFYVK